MMYLVNVWLSGKCPVAGIPSLRALVILLGYAILLAGLGAILPGKNKQGASLADGTKITYKCNGLVVLAVTLILGVLGVALGAFPPTILAIMGGELFTTTLAITVAMSSLLYVLGRLSRSTATSLRPHITPSFIRDWWFGVQLNPQIFGMDLKFFCLRPGMMGWLLLNLSLAARQLAVQGRLCSAMLLYQLLTGVYVVDYFVHEEYMTSTWDILAENFGFMLVFGDLCFIPFTFTTQAWWLVIHPVDLSAPYAFFVAALFCIGYIVFRGANAQKHKFKQDPQGLIWGKPPKTVGGRLLVSGYWGVARHCNYMGDILLALSYSLPCGFSSWIPYFYPFYLTVLLIWRERRDEARCAQKYKETWKEYCRTVPWRIFPFVY